MTKQEVREALEHVARHFLSQNSRCGGIYIATDLDKLFYDHPPLEKTREIFVEVDCRVCKRKVYATDKSCWWCGEKDPGASLPKPLVCVHCKRETEPTGYGCDHCGRDPTK